MSDDSIYKFHIAAYTPDTIPMARLAEYMVQLATLFGEKDNVHFVGLQPGSTNVLSRVEYEAIPKVRENLASAQTGDGNLDVLGAYKAVNEMLRKDNADAQLFLGSSNVLTFPGKNALLPPKLGPFTQGIEKDGVLVRIGGKDKSAHAMIIDNDGNTWNFEVPRELAVELAPYLFGKPIRLTGTGRWFRDEDGNWQHNNSLKASAFYPLNADSLADVVGRIRQLPEDTWKQGIDPLEMLRSLRDDDNGVH